MSYAVIKTGGKQYRVEEGQTLLVERLREDEGAKVSLDPLLYRDDKQVLDGSDLSKVKVEATIVGHERGPKIHVLKFKPKRGNKRRTGHRQELTRIEVTGIKLAARRAPAKKPADDTEEKPKPARKPPARKPAASRAKKEDSDGS